MIGARLAVFVILVLLVCSWRLVAPLISQLNRDAAKARHERNAANRQRHFAARAETRRNRQEKP